MTQQRSWRRLGALFEGDRVRLRVWAPAAARVEAVISAPTGGYVSPPAPNPEATLALEPVGDGYFERLTSLAAGTLYRYRLDGGEPMPDPASRFQPHGVHGPSQLVDPSAFRWTDAAWQSPARRDLVFYELHVGTFTPEGTYAAARERLSELRDLGVTAVELMPLGEFPGRWNWGYDHAALYAPSRAYGTPDELRAFVDAAHGHGLAVFFDVVHNHFGPDGAYVFAYGPVHSEVHDTPWGKAINLDGPHSRGVRDLLIDSALHWLREYHADGLRLDAVFALHDDSAEHFLAELTAAVAGLDGPRRYVIAEDNRNLRAVIEPRDAGGYGLDAVWADDFHHQIRNITTGETQGYFAEFANTTAASLCRTIREGWYRAAEAERGGRPGRRPVRLDQFVWCIQNHDQVGNRPTGLRLHHEIAGDLYRAISALLLFAPELPLLFMGQEWAASTPFLYFTDHHSELGAQVSAGRKAEFGAFAGFAGEVPDPQDPATFARSKLDWAERLEAGHAHTLTLYSDLLALRRELHGDVQATPHGDHGLVLRRGTEHLLVALAPEQSLPRLPDTRIVLHTEQPAYAPVPRPPRVGSSLITFLAPGAVVLSG